jgi:hypothetical protein
MKTTLGGHSSFLHTATMPHVPDLCHDFDDDLKERVMDALSLLAVIVVIVALNVAMSVAFYRWSRYAPIFQPDGADGPAIMEPWGE